MSESVESLARGCVLAGFSGPRAPRWLLDQLSDGLGGVVLFASNIAGEAELAGLTASLRSARPDVVVAVDEEGGEVTRLDAVTGSRVPGAAALGALDDPEATAAVYAGIGARLRAAGVDVDLAPVADVNSNPRNPVIGVRSFGATSALVARHVAAAVRALQSSGVAACAKHFPGHGDTEIDSHRAVAAVGRSKAGLDSVDLPPFRAAIEAGTRAMMTGHLLVPALDADRIATLSPVILADLLRDELGFAGTVITDALEMRAVSGPVGIVSGAVAALAAGADALCLGAEEYPHLIEEIPAAVVAAVDSGQLEPRRVADAAARTRALATRTGSAPGRELDAAAIAHLACRAIEVDGPLPALTAPQLLEFRAAGSVAAGPMRWSLAGRLAAAVAGAVVLDDPAAIDQDRDLVVVLRDPARHPAQAALRDRLRQHRAAVLVVDVGWPDDWAGGLTTMYTRGTAPPLLSAAAHLIVEASTRETGRR